MKKTVIIGQDFWIKPNLSTIGTAEFKPATFKKKWKVQAVELTNDAELVVVQDINKQKYLIEIHNLEEFNQEDIKEVNVKTDLENKYRLIERPDWLYNGLELVVIPKKEDCPYEFGSKVQVTDVTPVSLFPHLVEVKKGKNGKKNTLSIGNLRLLENQKNYHELMQLNIDIINGKTGLDSISNEDKQSLISILKKL